jgi:hypothetical protein
MLFVFAWIGRATVQHEAGGKVKEIESHRSTRMRLESLRGPAWEAGLFLSCADGATNSNVLIARYLLTSTEY